jgi:tRNA(Ile)-lysidine synthase
VHLVSGHAKPPRRFARRWRGEQELAVPELGGVLALRQARGEGISLACLRGHPVTIDARRGGERIQPDCRRPRRTLKNLLQEARVPSWERERLPVIRCAGKVVWVAGIGVDCEFQAEADEAAVRPAWIPGS